MENDIHKKHSGAYQCGSRAEGGRFFLIQGKRFVSISVMEGTGFWGSQYDFFDEFKKRLLCLGHCLEAACIKGKLDKIISSGPF